jgi:hypothetical protein
MSKCRHFFWLLGQKCTILAQIKEQNLRICVWRTLRDEEFFVELVGQHVPDVVQNRYCIGMHCLLSLQLLFLGREKKAVAEKLKISDPEWEAMVLYLAHLTWETRMNNWKPLSEKTLWPDGARAPEPEEYWRDFAHASGTLISDAFIQNAGDLSVPLPFVDAN